MQGGQGDVGLIFTETKHPDMAIRSRLASGLSSVAVLEILPLSPAAKNSQVIFTFR